MSVFPFTFYPSRFDPDKEIESLEKQEEKEKKKMQEKVRATNKNAISANVDLTGNMQLCLRYMKQIGEI